MRIYVVIAVLAGVVDSVRIPMAISVQGFTNADEAKTALANKRKELGIKLGAEESPNEVQLHEIDV